MDDDVAKIVVKRYLEIFAEIANAFIVSIDTAGALFPLTIQTLLIVGGLGIASSTVRRLIKR